MYSLDFTPVSESLRNFLWVLTDMLVLKILAIINVPRFLYHMFNKKSHMTQIRRSRSTKYKIWWKTTICKWGSPSLITPWNLLFKFYWLALPHPITLLRSNPLFSEKHHQECENRWENNFVPGGQPTVHAGQITQQWPLTGQAWQIAPRRPTLPKDW